MKDGIPICSTPGIACVVKSWECVDQWLLDAPQQTEPSCFGRSQGGNVTTIHRSMDTLPDQVTIIVSVRFNRFLKLGSNHHFQFGFIDCWVMMIRNPIDPKRYYPRTVWDLKFTNPNLKLLGCGRGFRWRIHSNLIDRDVGDRSDAGDTFVTPPPPSNLGVGEHQIILIKLTASLIVSA